MREGRQAGRDVGDVTILFALVGIAVVVGVALLAVGRLGELPDAPPDRAPLDVPDGPLEADDVDSVRFAVGLRGYRMDEVDVVLDRLSTDLAVRDARIADLERALGGTAAPAGDVAFAPSALAHADVPEADVAEADGPQVTRPEADAPEATGSGPPATDVTDPLDRRWRPEPAVPPVAPSGD